MNDPYLVAGGDTVASVATRAGITPELLRRLNHLESKEAIATGQTLYLSERTSYGFTTLFLDALRHPIENLSYQLKFDEQVVSGKTPANGMAPRKITKSAESAVEVWTQNAQGMWQQVTTTESGYGHKLITLVSAAVVVPGKTEMHPTGVPTQPSLPGQAVGGPKPGSTIRACSWGKFQVMGDNFEICRAVSLVDFVNSMCTSEYEQVRLLAGFIQRKPRSWKDFTNKKLGKEISLWEAVKAKDWAAIAFNYNGPGYRTFKYGSRLKAAYEQFVSEKSDSKKA